MNIKILAESKQEQILYTPYHISYNLTGYTQIDITRNYYIKNCSAKDVQFILKLENKDIAYFFFGHESSCISLFKEREADYVGLKDGYFLVVDKQVMDGHINLTLSVHVSFILYVEDNPRIDWFSYLFFVAVLFFAVLYLLI